MSTVGKRSGILDWVGIVVAWVLEDTATDCKSSSSITSAHPSSLPTAVASPGMTNNFSKSSSNPESIFDNGIDSALGTARMNDAVFLFQVVDGRELAFLLLGWQGRSSASAY